MTDSVNVKLPRTLMRIGQNDINKLIISGLYGEVTRENIYDLLVERYPERKRAAREILRSVRDFDIEQFNREMEHVRSLGFMPNDQLRIDTSMPRAITQILKFKD